MESSVNVIGIDPSLTGTAIVWDLGVPGNVTLRRISEPTRGSLVRNRVARYVAIVDQVVSIANSQPDRVTVAYLEGYSFASKGNAGRWLAEYGGILRRSLLAADVPIVEIAPGALKKFATGKGNASKVAVATAIARRYDVQFDTDDEYDAYALYRLGLVAEGLDDVHTKQQAEAVAKLVSGVSQ